MMRKIEPVLLVLLIAVSWLTACAAPAALSTAVPAESPTSTRNAFLRWPVAFSLSTAVPAESPTSTATPLAPPTAIPATATPQPSPTPAVTIQVQWRFATSGALWGPPAFRDGVVFVGSDDGHLYAVTAQTGEQVWAFAAGGVVRARPDFAEVDGRTLVYFTSDDGYLYAVEAASGGEVWRADIGNVTDRAVRTDSIGNSPNPTGYDYLQSSPVAAGERVYIGSADGKVYALDAATGEVAWAFQTGAKVRATPNVTAGVVYVGSWDKTMLALDAQTGELRWQTPVYGQVQTTALVVDDLVYSASRKASVVALNVETGEKVWEFNYGGNMWVESSPTLLDDMLYIGSSGSRTLFALERQTGIARMRYNVGAFCWPKPLLLAETKTLVTGCINVAGGSHGLFVYSIVPDETMDHRLTLAEMGHVPVGEALEISGEWEGVTSSPIYAEGVVYFGGLDGVLCAITME